MNASNVCYFLYNNVKSPDYETLLYAIIPILISFVAIPSNLILIFTMYKTGQNRSVSKKLILIMTSSDLFTGIFLPVYFHFINSHDSAIPCALKKTLEFFFVVSLHFSFNIFCCVTLDRYFHIMKASRYHEFMNSFRFKLVVYLSFLLATIVVLALFLFPFFVTITVVSLFSIACIAAMACANFLMSRVLKQLRVKVVSGLSAGSVATSESSEAKCSTANTRNARVSTVTNPKETNIKQQVHAVKIIWLLIISLGTLYVPFDILSIVSAYFFFYTDHGPSLSFDVALYCSAVFIISNCWINSIIILLGNSKCKRYIRLKWRWSAIQPQGT